MTDHDPAHAEEEAATETADTGVELWLGPEDVDELIAEARARQAPYIATATTAAAGWSLWGVAEMVGAVGGADARSVAVAGTVAATAAAVPVVRATLSHRIPDEWRRRWWLGSAGAAAWIDLTAAYGPSLELTAGLAFGAVAVCSRWAAEHELPNPGDVPPPEVEPVPALPIPPPPPPIPLPEPVDISRAAQFEQAWIDRVAGGRNPIAAGSILVGREDLPNGNRWLVELDPEGTLGATELLNQGVRIARALQTSRAHIILERLTGADDREDLAELTIVTKDLLIGGVPYCGPRYNVDRIPYGLYADGNGEAEWITVGGSGVVGGIVAGGQGSGKSHLLALLGMAYRASGEWAVVFGDGDELGNSSHLLKRAAHDFAQGPEEVLQQLEALEHWYRFRGLQLAGLAYGPDGAPVPMTDPCRQVPVDWIRPSPRYRGFIWILDEFHRLANNPMLKSVNFVGRCEMLQRIMRKTGGAEIVGTQSLLTDDFGGNATYRGLLAQGNLVAMRSGNKSEQHVVGDFGIAPSTLPVGGGYGFGGNGEQRRAMMRVERSEAMHEYLVGLPDLDESDPALQVYRRYRQRKIIDPVAAFHERNAAMAEWEEALATGAPLPGEEKAKEETEAKVADAQVMTVGGVGIPQPPPSNVVPLAKRQNVAQPPEPAKPAKVAPLAALGPLSVKAQKVLAALQSRPGAWRSRDLVAFTGLSAPDVSKALGVLVARGLAHRPSDVQGVYAAGSGPVDASAAAG